MSVGDERWDTLTKKDKARMRCTVRAGSSVAVKSGI